MLTTFKSYRKFFSACDLFSQWRIKYVFASEQGQKAKKGRLFSFGFLGFSRPVRNAQAAFFMPLLQMNAEAFPEKYERKDFLQMLESEFCFCKKGWKVDRNDVVVLTWERLFFLFPSPIEYLICVDSYL